MKQKLARAEYQAPFVQPSLLGDGAMVLDAQNAADWIDARSNSESMKELMDSIPVSVAPWPKTLVLWKNRDKETGRYMEAACLVEQTQVPSESWEVAGQERWDVLKIANVHLMAQDGKKVGIGEVHPDLLRQEFNAKPVGPLAFIQEIAIYAYSPGQSDVNFWGYGALPLGPTGRILVSNHAFITADQTSLERDKQLLCIGMTLITSAAFLFANTKNIQTIEGRIRKPPRIRYPDNPHLTKEGEIVYKTLEIGGITKKLNESQDSAEAQGQMTRAFHFCKGHFSTYGPDAPLFGKHIGTFWVPMHTRGTRLAGTVEKDYKVSAPK